MHQRAEHIPALDGLRGLAALLVMLSHLRGKSGFLDHWLGPGFGQYGVMIFFMLSGFLMGHLYLNARPDRASLTRYAVARGARVLPLYFTALGVTYGLALLSPAERGLYAMAEGDALLRHLFFLEGYSVFWTIAPELQFYIAFGLIWLLHAWRSEALILVLAGCALAWFALDLGQAGTRTSLVRYVHFFLGGLGVAWLYGRARTHEAGRWGDALFLLGLSTLLVSAPDLGSIILDRPSGLWRDPLAFFSCGVLLYGAAISPLARTVLGSPVGVFMGAISYSFYLWHQHVIIQLDRTGLFADHAPLFALSALAITLAISYLSFRLIETPARAMLNGLVRR